ncbi:hypothetical protein EJB05_33696, partial [Eragrostis curvula]
VGFTLRRPSDVIHVVFVSKRPSSSHLPSSHFRFPEASRRRQAGSTHSCATDCLSASARDISLQPAAAPFPRFSSSARRISSLHPATAPFPAFFSQQLPRHLLTPTDGDPVRQHPGQPCSRPPAPWDCRFRRQDPYWSSICMRKCTYIICAIAFTSHVHYDAPSEVEETAESVVDEHWLGELQNLNICNGEEGFLPRYAFKDKNDSVLTGSHNSVVEFVKLHSAVCGSKQEQHSNKTDPLPNTPADISS